MANHKLCIRDPTQPICHWLMLGFCVGGNANFMFLDTNMLVSPRRNCGVGGLSQRQDPTQTVLRRSEIIGLKPIFYQKLCWRWLPNARKNMTNNMKLTCPTQTQQERDQLKHFGIGNAKGLWGSIPMPVPHANPFMLW